MTLGVVGLPVFAESKHGVDVILGTTGGYLIGFIAWRRRSSDGSRSSAGTATLAGRSA
ncbi:MAG: biotin transporter BioY [Chloroflexota bacterium]